jgi:hypothetical protein
MQETIVATAMPHKRHIKAIQSECPSLELNAKGEMKNEQSI